MNAHGIAILLTLVVVSACGSIFDSTECTTEARPGIRLEVLDSATRAPAGGAAALIIARDGSLADTARSFSPDSSAEAQFAVLAFERPGIYEITVQRAGYHLWRRSGVRVMSGECHVRTVEITALLQRLS